MVGMTKRRSGSKNLRETLIKSQEKTKAGSSTQRNCPKDGQFRFARNDKIG
jgi:hypothetical protein